MAAHQAPLSLGFSRQEHWSELPFSSLMHESEKWKWSCSVMSDSSWLHWLQPTRLLRSWDFPGKSTGVGCQCLLWENSAELFKILKESAALNMPANLENSQDWKRSVFIPIPKKGNAKECSNYSTIALISHTSKVTLKILQARLQQYVNWELPDVQDRFSKGRGIRDQIAKVCRIIEKSREFQKIYFYFIDYTKAFDCVDHNKLWEILKEMGIPAHLTCLLRNLHAGQEATVRTRHGTTDWFQIGKGVRQVFILLPCWFDLYSEYII